MLGEEGGRGEVEGLVHPEGLEAGEGLGLAGGPRGEIGGDAGGAALGEDALRLGIFVIVGREEGVEERGVVELREIAAGEDGVAFGGDAPDAAVDLVAADVAEIDLAVLDDRVAPVGDVKRAVGPELGVEGAEAGIGRAKEIGQLAGDVGGALIGGFEAHDAVGAEIGGDEVALPVGGEVGAVNDFDAREFGIVAGADAAEETPGGGVSAVGRSGDAPTDAGAASTVGHEGFAGRIELVAPSVDPAPEEDRELLIARIETEDAAGREADNSVGRLGVGAGVNGLGEIEPAIGAPTRTVDVVVGVFGAEAAEDDAALVGLAVAVGVAEVEEFGALGDVGAAVAGRDAGGNEQAVGEDRGFVGAAGASGVFEDDDLVGGGLAGLDLRINLGAGDPEAAGRVEVHVDRFIQQGIFGPERDLKGVVDGEGRRGLRREFGIEITRAQGRHGGGVGRGGIQRAEAGDAGFLGGDVGVELEDLDGVLALLLFPEAENVGHVGGAGAVEEPLVFAQDGLAERFGVGAGAPRAGGAGGGRGAEEKIFEGEGGGAVAGGVEVDAVVGEFGGGRGGGGHGRGERVEEGEERETAGGGDIADGGGEAGESGVVRGRIGPWVTEEFVARGAQKDEARGGSELGEGVEQPGVVGGELCLTGGAVEGVRHAVADEDHGGFRVGDLLLELDRTLIGRLEAGLHEAEAGAGGARGRVGAPAEVAGGDSAVAGAGGEHELDPAVVLLALDEGVAEEDDAVTVAEFKGRGSGRFRAASGDGKQKANEREGTGGDQETHGQGKRFLGRR